MTVSVTSIKTAPAVGDLNAGRGITFTLAVDQPVTVAGVPSLILSDGGTAAYNAAASSPSSLVFATSVAAGDNTADLKVTGLQLNGGSITPTASQTATVSFGATSYALSSRSDSVAVADLNGDGKPDLVATRGDAGAGGGVSVLLGNGSGGFGTVTSYAIGGSPSSVAVADLNGDGIPDLIVNSYSGIVGNYKGGMAVLLGNGSGGFAAATTIGEPIGSFAAADLNGDGKVDLVTTDGVGVSVRLGNGNGGFGALTPYASGPAGSNTAGVTIADFNGDGKPDLAVAAGGGVAILLNNGGGGFGPATIYAGGEHSSGVTAADLNGDGKTDLVLVDVYNYNLVRVLLGNGSGGFGPPTSYSVANGPTSVAAADVNGDGKLDLVAATFRGGVAVLLGDGTGGFGGAATYGAGPNPTSVTAADVNGDGKPDLVVSDAGGAVSVLLNTTASTNISSTLVVATAPGADTGLIIDTITPTIVSDTTSPATGDYGAGRTMAFTLATSEAVTVTGAPTLTLNDGGAASYVASASTASGLVFTRTVAAGQNAATLAVTGLVLNGATIQDGAGNNAVLAGANAIFTGLEVDTTPPVVSSPTLSVPTNAAAAPIGIAAPADTGSTLAQLAITAVTLPTNGRVMLSDGVTAVTAGMALTAAQLTSLLFIPTTGLFAAQSGFTYSVTDAAGNATSGMATLAIRNTPFAGFAVASPVAGEVVTITVGFLPATSGTFAAGLGGTTPPDGASYSFTGTIVAANAVLQQLTFVPNSGALAQSGLRATLTSTSGTAALSDSGTGHDQLLSVGNNTLSTNTAGSAVNLGSGSAAAVLRGNDTVVGGTGQNTVSATTGNVLVTPGSGSLGFANGSGISTVAGSAGSATVAGGTGGGVFFGGQAGNNRITAGQQATTIYGGGAGDQMFLAGTGGDLAVGGSGTETVYGNGSVGNDTIYTGAFDGSGNGVAVLGFGNDMVFARGSDTILAGAGSDTVGAVGTANVLVIGGPGRLNFSASGAGKSTVGGGAGSDTIYGASGGGVFYGGGGGNNVLIAGLAATTLYGGGGGGALFTEGTAGDLAVAGSGTETIYGNGSSGNDTIYTGAFDGSGNSVAVLGSGNDLVYARGSDTIAAGSGSDTINAVGGANVFAYGTGGRLTFINGTGTAKVGDGSGSDTLFGGQGGGQFYGGLGGNNVLVAGVGASTLVGGGLGDVLTATGTAGDVLISGSGSETLNGAQSGGADLFFAKAGTDRIVGGYGRDRFFAGSGAATVVAGTGADIFGFVNGSAGGSLTVLNFKAAIDQVYLEGYAKGTGANALQAAVVAQGNTTLVLPDQSRITFVGIASSSNLTLTG